MGLFPPTPEKTWFRHWYIWGIYFLLFLCFFSCHVFLNEVILSLHSRIKKRREKKTVGSDL